MNITCPLNIFETNPKFKELVHCYDNQGYKFDYEHFWTKVFPIIKDRIVIFSDLLEYDYLYRYLKVN